MEVNSAGSVLFETPESPAEQNLRGRPRCSGASATIAEKPKLFEKTLASCAISGELAVPAARYRPNGLSVWRTVEKAPGALG